MIETKFELPGVTRVLDTVISGQLIQRTLYIDSDYLAECATLWSSGNFTELGISSYQNAYKLNDVEFLRAFPTISRFHVYLDRIVNLAPLTHHAGSLIRFYANDGKNMIDDLSPFDRLENIGQVWSANTIFPETMRSLQGMGWVRFNPKARNFECLPNAPNLKSFGCVNTNVETLSGIERYPNLSTLSITTASRLTNVSELAHLTQLTEVEFEGCKHVANIADGLTSICIEWLKLMNCGRLPSISFIMNLPSLKKFIFMDTDVADGDMSWLFKHPHLEFVAFTRKKHFTHSEKQVMDHIATTGRKV